MGFDSYRLVINAIKNNKPTDQVVRAIKGSIDRYLHTQDKILLNVVLFLLWETANMNKSMKAQNLGIVFGQIFFQAPISFNGDDKEDVAETMREIGYANKAVEFMIANYQKLFTGREKYIQKIYEPYYHERYLPESNEEEILVMNTLYSGEGTETSEGNQVQEETTDKNDNPARIKTDFEDLISRCTDEKIQSEMKQLLARIKPYLTMQ